MGKVLAKTIRPLVAIGGILLIVAMVYGLKHGALVDAQAADNPSTLDFSDNFTNGKLSDWNVFDEPAAKAKTWASNWSVNSQGVLQETSNMWGGDKPAAAIAKPATYITGGNYGWRDYDFSLRLRTDDDDGIGVLFHYTDDNNYYRLSFNKEQNFVQLVKKVNGTYTLIGSKPASDFNVGQWYTLRTVLTGSSIRITMDDTTLFDVSDSSLASGRVGLYSWGSSASYFDDILVRATIGSGFTIAILPDTQEYAKSAPAVFTAQTKWLAENRGQSKIAFVLHEGDVVNDICDATQWQRASDSMSYLDGKIPYAIAPGNHDILSYASCPSTPNSNGVLAYPAKTVLPGPINDYFPVSRFSGNGTFGGTLAGSNDISNSYQLFSAGGIDFLVVALQFGPTDAQLDAAKQVIERYASRTVIVVTHDYLSEKSKLRGIQKNTNDKCTLGTTNIFCTPTNGATGGTYAGEDWALPSVPGMNSGVEIWEKLVSKEPNIRFVFNGHVGVAGGQLTDNVGQLASQRPDGTWAYQMLANYQAVTATQNGYMRLIKFSPQDHKIDVTTYSPYLNKYATDSKNQFTINDITW